MATLIHGVCHVLKPELLHRSGGFFFGTEVPDMMHNAFDRGASDPLIFCPKFGAALFEPYSTMFGRATPTPFVLTVLSRCNKPQITAPVIEPLPIDVIYDGVITVADTHDFSVQIDRLSRANADGPVISTHMPTMLVDPLGIYRIDQAVGSNGTVTSIQRDEGDILNTHQITPGVSPRVVRHCGGASSLSVAERRG